MKPTKLPTVANLLFPRTVEDLFHQVWREPLDGAAPWTPRIDVEETEAGYLIRAELPGVDPAAVELTATADSLTLAGTKAAQAERVAETEADAEAGAERDAPKAKSHLRERKFGAFSRTFTFPAAISTDEVEATFRHGVLTVTLRKAAASQTRRIEIRDE